MGVKNPIKAPYTGHSDLKSPFPPGYPLLVRMVSKLSGLKLQPAGIWVSRICLLVTLFLMYFYLPTGPPQKKDWMPLLMLLSFPTAFILVSFYSESLFLLTCLLSYILVQKKKYLSATLVAFLAGLTRPHVIALIPFLGLKALGQVDSDGKRDFKSLWPVYGAFMGFLTPMVYYHFTYGDFRLYLESKKSFFYTRPDGFFNILVAPIHEAINHFSRFENIESLIGYIDVICAVLVVGGGIYLYRKKRVAESVFVMMFFLLNWIAGTFWALPRHFLILFPIFSLTSQWGNRFLLSAGVLMLLVSLQVLFLFNFVIFAGPAP